MTSKTKSPPNSKAGQIAAEREGFFSDLFKYHEAVMLLIDPASGHILEANLAAEKFYGYPLAQLRAMLISEINVLPPADIHAARQHAAKNQLNFFIFPHRLANGKVRTVEVHSSPIKWQEEEVLFSIIHDITERITLEHALREAELRWGFALEGAGDGVWDWNVETNHVFFSRQWKTMLGYAEDEIGNTLAEWAQRVHPADLPEVQTLIDQHFTGETPFYASEHRVRCKDGTYKWILDRGKVIAWTPEGRPLRVIGTHTDITARREMEEQVRESEIRYRSLFEQTHDAVFILDLQGRHTKTNHRAAEMLGYTAAELARLSVRDLSAEITQSENVLAHLMQGESVPPYERLFRKKDGTLLPVELTVELIRNADGTPLHLQSVARDISQRKQAEAALRKSEAQYRSVVTALEEGIVLQNQTGEIVAHNTAAEKILGLTIDQLTGRTSADPRWQSVHEDGTPFPSDTHPAMHTLGTGEPQHGVVMGIHQPDDSLTWISINSQPIFGETATPVAVVTSFTDITVRKQMEDTLRHSETHYRIVADNTHDWEFWQAPDGHFIYSSPSCQRVTGHKAEEFLQNPNLLLNIVHPEHRRPFLAHQEFVHNNYTVDEIEFRILMPTGGWRWINHVCRPVFDEQGTYLGVRGSNRDITERKQNEQLLEVANRQLLTQLTEIEKLRDELREQALHDPLTGLYNRRYLADMLARETARATRDQLALSLIIADIDFFKLINDTFGHQAGDKFLVGVANLLRENSRASDIVCRYGGEEFLLVLPETTLESAVKRAEELRQKCAALLIPYEGKELYGTMSFGVAVYPLHGATAEEVIIKADKALYHSKQHGRNRVTA